MSSANVKAPWLVIRTLRRALLALVRTLPAECSVDDCGRQASRSSLCAGHAAPYGSAARRAVQEAQ
jgi:hypothetical protein